MPKYELFAGCPNAEPHGIYEYDTIEQAEYDAYELAVEDYYRKEGCSNYPSYNQCRDDAIESFGCEDWTEDDFQALYLETIESNISYYAELIP